MILYHLLLKFILIKRERNIWAIFTIVIEGGN